MTKTTITELVYHEITVEARGSSNVFRADVFRGGEIVDVDLDTGEATFRGGRKVATLYRRSEAEAIGSAITYSRITRPA